MSSPTPPPATSILVVDDDTEMAALLVRVLRAEGWAIGTAATGAKADAALARALPDAVVLDVMLPDASGMDLCRRWRAEHPALGILMLTARGDPIDRILGLELGADDYLPKPFERRELVARLRSLLRRRTPMPAPAPTPAPPTSPVSVLTFGALRIDLLQREVSVDQRAVPLTSIEFKLLLELIRVPGRVVSREALNDAVQAGNYRPLDRTVDVQVGRLRRRLASVPGGNDWIETVRGEGYAFVTRGSGVASSGHVLRR
jgi:two-component system phosphate regulon response regulator OmpR